MSDYQLVLEQLQQEKRFNGELLKENWKLKKKNEKLSKELKEYKFLLNAKLERLRKWIKRKREGYFKGSQERT